MSTDDIRWIQRFSNFNKALTKLEQAVRFVEANRPQEMSEDEPEVLNELIQQGLIQAFEFTHELAWKMMKDYAFFSAKSAVHRATSRLEASRYSLSVCRLFQPPRRMMAF